jgi:hypothetical protein
MMAMTTPEQRSARSSRLMTAIHANRSPEEKAAFHARINERVKETWAQFTPEERSIRNAPHIAKALATLTPEIRAANGHKYGQIGGLLGGKASWADLSPEQRTERALRANKTTQQRAGAEEYAARMTRANRASHTPEAEDKRRAAVERQMADPEQRNALAKRVAAMTPEQRQEMARKAEESRRINRERKLAQTYDALLSAT